MLIFVTFSIQGWVGSAPSLIGVALLCGLQEDQRTDGRRRRDYRPMEVETGLVTHAAGSARLRLANTDVLVGVKAEVGEPLPERPRAGRIHFSVDW